MCKQGACSRHLTDGIEHAQMNRISDLRHPLAAVFWCNESEVAAHASRCPTKSAMSVRMKPRPQRNGASGNKLPGLSSSTADPSRWTKPAEIMTGEQHKPLSRLAVDKANLSVVGARQEGVKKRGPCLLRSAYCLAQRQGSCL